MILKRARGCGVGLSCPPAGGGGRGAGGGGEKGAQWGEEELEGVKEHA